MNLSRRIVRVIQKIQILPLPSPNKGIWEHTPGIFVIPIVCYIGILASGCTPHPETSSLSTPTQEGSFILSDAPEEVQEMTWDTKEIKLVSSGEKEVALMVEVAKTSLQQQVGLMYRSSLPFDRGMLFVYPAPQEQRYWMKNVHFPLELLFFGDDNVLQAIIPAPPCASDEKACPTYGPAEKAQYVLEVAEGFTSTYGIEVGKWSLG